MRIFLYNNGSIVKSMAGLKSSEEYRVNEKLLNEYMYFIGSNNFEGKKETVFTDKQTGELIDLTVYYIDDETGEVYNAKDAFEILIKMQQATIEEKSNKAKEYGKLQKKYTITNTIRRKIDSAAVTMFKNRKYNLTFFTLTLPENYDHKHTNQSLSRFFENLTKNYCLSAYIATYELQNSGRGHYHCIFDMPFVAIGTINRAWLSALHYEVKTENGNKLPPSVRLPEKRNRTVVLNVNNLVRYLTKYIGKIGVIHEERCYFLSRNITNFSEELTESELKRLKKQKGYTEMHKSEFFETGFLNNYLDKTDTKYNKIEVLAKKRGRKPKKTEKKQ
jgi:hypothetical protein